MGSTDTDECTAIMPMRQALEQHRYQIQQLRNNIACKQMELKIEFARYTAVKKLAAKGAK